jgi:putative chitinase
VTPEQLRAAIGCSVERANLFAQPLSVACAFYGIDNQERLAAFLAQIGHESGSLRFTTELWGPTPAQSRYEGRADLGNVQPGDGFKFRGRGLIQTTGRHNYARVRNRLRERFNNVPDFEKDPDKLTDPQWAALSAADYWDDKGLNALADAGQFEKITRLINGGLNGQADRLARWERAKQALSNSSHSGALGSAQEAPVAPFIAAALPALIEAAPSLIRIFGKGERSEQNAKAAEVVAEIAKEATAQPTVEGAVNALQSDPQAAAAYREAVHQRFSDLVALSIQVSEAEDKSRAAALDRNLTLAKASGGRWLWLLGLVSVLVVIASYVITWRVLFGENVSLSDETKALLIGQIVIFGFAAVLQFLYGSNIQNRINDQKKE